MSPSLQDPGGDIAVFVVSQGPCLLCRFELFLIRSTCSTSCPESPHNPGRGLHDYLHLPNGPVGLREGVRLPMGGPPGTWQSKDSLLQAPWSALGSRSWSSPSPLPPGEVQSLVGPSSLAAGIVSPNWEMPIRPRGIHTGLTGPQQLKLQLLLGQLLPLARERQASSWSQRAEDLRSILTASQEAWKALPVF